MFIWGCSMYKTAVFIITHGRPFNQRTLQTLTSFSYTGKVYLVLDDEDTTIDDYVKTYGTDSILVFNKEKYINETDTGLHRPYRKFAVFARNAVEDLAVELGLDYFMVFDDDITNFRIRYDENGSLKSCSLSGIIDDVFESCIKFMADTGIHCTSFGFCNVYRSGVECLYTENSRNRLCAEAFIRDTKIRVHWRLNMVEDLITSLDYNRMGDVWLQLLPVQVEILMSEGAVEGGNSDAYNDFGLYRLNFMPTIAYPDCNVVKFHNGKWRTTLSAVNSVPKIVSSKCRQPVAN